MRTKLLDMRSLLAGIAAVLLLAGCASVSSDSLPEDVYFDTVREHEGFEELRDSSIKGIGAEICAAMGQDVREPYLGTLKTLLDGGIEAGDAGALIAFSTSQYCPEHLDLIPAL